MVFAANLRANDSDSRAAAEHLCALLSEDIGREVRAHFAHAPSALAEALSEGKAHFAWISPTLLLMSSKLATIVPLLSSVREGVATFHTVLFTAASTDIESMDDLHEARAAWVAPTSASGYLVARLTLARCGIDLDEALAEEEFLDSHGAVCRAVMSGEADVGATYAHFEGGTAKGRLLSTGYMAEVPNAAGRILAVGGPIPADMIVAHPSVPIRDRIAFAAALSRLANCAVGGASVRDVIGAESFQAVSHASLCELEALMQAND